MSAPDRPNLANLRVVISPSHHPDRFAPRDRPPPPGSAAADAGPDRLRPHRHRGAAGRRSGAGRDRGGSG
jgi:hypothetical protein